MLSADTAIKTIIIVPVQKLVVRVAIGQKILIGYVARKLHAVFRTEQIWAPKICSIMVLNAMVSNMLGILERTTTVVLVSVATLVRDRLWDQTQIN